MIPRSIFALLILLTASLMFGCGRQGEPSSATSKYAVPPPEEWITIPLEEFRGHDKELLRQLRAAGHRQARPPLGGSNDKELLRRLRRLDATARELAQPDWEYQPYHLKRETDLVWSAWWTMATPSTQGFKQSFLNGTRLPQLPPQYECHIISIHASRNPRIPLHPEVIETIGIRAARHPRIGEWSAAVVYYIDSHPHTYFRRTISFDLIFSLRTEDVGTNERPRLVLREHLTSFQREKRYGDTAYRIRVALRPVPSSDDQVARWFASPESLRDAALERLDLLTAKVESDIPAGRGVEGTMRWGWTARAIDADSILPVAVRPAVSGPFPAAFIAYAPAPPPSGRQLMAEEIQELLEEARAEIDRSRALVLAHYAEMHAALTATFPLGDCLTEQGEPKQID